MYEGSGRKSLADRIGDYLTRRRCNGAGARRTERALVALEPQGWALDTCDEAPGHILAGPGGVFLIETYDLGGPARIERGEVVARAPGGQRRENFAPHLLAATRELSGAIRERSGLHVWIEPVVVLWSRFDAGEHRVGRVTYVHGTMLAGWVTDQHQTISPEQLRAACNFFELRASVVSPA